MSGIYTDLAMELRELNPGIQGISEQNEQDGEIAIKRIGIFTANAAAKVGKAMGNYVSLDSDALSDRPREAFDAVSKRLAQELRALIRLDVPKSSFLIVGLGNRNVTPDSLGPKTIEKILITRHVKQHLPEVFESDLASVSAIAPGVLGITGVETMEIIKGVAERTAPDCIIVIDSLASRRAARINSTIQLSDAGISPGSGVGNRRADISSRTLGVPVIAIGVPLVVHASTIARDIISAIAKESGQGEDEKVIETLTQRAAEKHLDNMIVTPKNIDQIVQDMSGMIADAINKAIFGDELENLKDLLM